MSYLNDLPPLVRGFLLSETEQNWVTVKELYVRINDNNLIDGVMFSKIMAWHGVNKETRKPFMKARHNDKITGESHLWVAKQATDWDKEVFIAERAARSSITRMVKRGLIIKQVNMWGAKPTTHLRINWEVFQERVNAYQNTNLEDVKRFDVSGQNELTATVKTMSLHKTSKRIDVSGQNHNNETKNTNEVKTTTSDCGCPCPSDVCSQVSRCKYLYEKAQLIWDYFAYDLQVNAQEEKGSLKRIVTLLKTNGVTEDIVVQCISHGIDKTNEKNPLGYAANSLRGNWYTSYGEAKHWSDVIPEVEEVVAPIEQTAGAIALKERMLKKQRVT